MIVIAPFIRRIVVLVVVVFLATTATACASYAGSGEDINNITELSQRGFSDPRYVRGNDFAGLEYEVGFGECRIVVERAAPGDSWVFWPDNPTQHGVPNVTEAGLRKQAKQAGVWRCLGSGM